MSYQNEIFGASKQVSRVDYVSWKGKCRCFLLGCWCSRMPQVRFRFQFPTKDIKSSRILVLTVTGMPRCLCGRYGENVSFKNKKWMWQKMDFVKNMWWRSVLVFHGWITWYSWRGGVWDEEKRIGTWVLYEQIQTRFQSKIFFCEVYGS